jgi:aryl-alcohol dehydrogenase-like predicted oxidoreductase
MLPPYEPARIEEGVRSSLERLGVAAIDLLYLHRWDAMAESHAALAALHGLVRAGKVRMLGASNFTVSQLAAAVALQVQHGFEPFRVIQNNHNLAVGDVTPQLREFCAAREIAIVTYSPLGAGFLTGKHRRGISPGSRFALVPGASGYLFPRGGLSAACAVGGGGGPQGAQPGAPRARVCVASAGCGFRARRWPDACASRSSARGGSFRRPRAFR